MLALDLSDWALDVLECKFFMQFIVLECTHNMVRLKYLHGQAVLLVSMVLTMARCGELGTSWWW